MKMKDELDKEKDNSTMRKKRKKIKKTIFVTIIILVIYYNFAPFFFLPSEIKELNNNINIPVKFGEKLNPEDFKDNWEVADGQNAIYYNNDLGDCFKFQGFPDLSSKFKLAYLTTNNPNIMLFGFKIGDSISSIESVLINNGYKVEYRSSYTADYRKGRVHIWISINNVESGTEIIEALNINLHSTDWLRIGNYK